MSTIEQGIAAPAPSAIPSGGLQRTITWKSAFVVSLGGSLLVATSLGTIAGDLGPASVFVWTFIAILGVIECLLIAEMAGMFPHKSGGTSTYTHEAFKKYPLIGAIANWGYWLGWIPVIPVNLILVAGYMQASFLPAGDKTMVGTAIVLGVLLYVLNYFGLKPGIWSGVLMAVCALGPMAVVCLSPIFRTSLFHAAFVVPFTPLGGSWHSTASWNLIFKDMFLAIWSAYAFEAASSVIAELKDPHKDGPKAMYAASVVGMFAYGLVPLMMLAIVGPMVLSKDASVAFLPAAQQIFGKGGGVVVSVMLIAALLLGAQTAIIGSSRTMYEMSRDGLTLKQFGKLNKFGVPVGSMVWDGIVTIVMLIKFGANVPNIIAASNVGYLIVFMLLTPAFVVLRYQQPDVARPFKLPNIFIPIAIVVTLFNWFLFFVGGKEWGRDVMLTGSIIMLLFIPFYAFRRMVQGAEPEPIPVGMHVLTEEEDLSGRRIPATD